MTTETEARHGLLRGMAYALGPALLMWGAVVWALAASWGH